MGKGHDAIAATGRNRPAWAAAAMVCLAASVAGCGVERFIYYPRPEEHGTPADAGMAYEEVLLKTSDGVALRAWYVPPAEEAGPVLLHCHGNAGNITDRVPLLAMLRGEGLGVMIFDYRGYGRSEGSPDEQGTYRDAMAAWTFLTAHKAIPPERIVLHGQSLGGGVASWLARQTRPAGLILDSTFTSLTDRGQEMFPLLPARLLIGERYPTRQRLAAIDCPVLVVHSRGDSVIPFSHGQSLFAAAKNPAKQFLEISGDHNSGPFLSRDTYAKGLSAFSRACLRPRK